MSFDVTTNIIGQNSATINRKAFLLEQMPPRLPSGVGQTRVMVFKSIIYNYPPLPFKSPFPLKHYPDPPPNRIGEIDLPGGFKKSDIISGQSTPLYNLAKGVVKIDDINVFFDALA
ncbi:hypothetical protein ACFL5B_00430 [Candidatus Latescibacterota bacterium]